MTPSAPWYVLLGDWSSAWLTILASVFAVAALAPKGTALLLPMATLFGLCLAEAIRRERDGRSLRAVVDGYREGGR